MKQSKNEKYQARNFLFLVPYRVKVIMGEGGGGEHGEGKRKEGLGKSGKKSKDL